MAAPPPPPPDDDGGPSASLSFADFVERMRDPAAADLVRTIRRYEERMRACVCVRETDG